MTVDFKPRDTSSFDQGSGTSIPMPRILPHTLPDGGDGIEYQFAFRRGDELVGGLGVYGAEEVVERSGQREWVYTLDLSSASVLRSMLRSKQALGIADDDVAFLRGLAQGLVNVFAGQINNIDNLRYVAFTRQVGLSHLGLAAPEGAAILPDGTIVLAEVFVPAHVA